MSKKLMVDFSGTLKDLEGKDLKETAGPATVRAALVSAGVSAMLIDQAVSALRPFWGTGGEPEETLLTAARACAGALQHPDQAATGATRVDNMRLALKLMDVQPVEVSEKEKDTILKAVEKAYPGPIVYFRVHELFERTAAAAAKEAALPMEAKAA